MKILLKLKHWQLFLLVLQPVCLLCVLALSPDGWRQILLWLLPMSLFVLSVTLLGWCYSAVSAIFSMLPPIAQPVGHSARSVILGAGFLHLLLVFFLVASTFGKTFVSPGILLIVQFAFSCIAFLFSMFHGMWLVAKYLSLAEYYRLHSANRHVAAPHLPNPMGDFILLWLFPIGLWRIQPRVQRLLFGG